MTEKSPPLLHAPASSDIEPRERRRRGGNRRAARMPMNLTSMIDVVFLLLVYFVLTASFTQGEGILTARFPQGPGPRSSLVEPPDRPLTIRISDYGDAGYRLALDGFEAPTNFTALSDLLASVQHHPEKGRHGAYRPDNPVVIEPDQHVRWTHVVNAFNAAVKARYSNVAFARAHRGNGWSRREQRGTIQR